MKLEKWEEKASIGKNTRVEER